MVLLFLYEIGHSPPSKTSQPMLDEGAFKFVGTGIGMSVLFTHGKIVIAELARQITSLALFTDPIHQRDCVITGNIQIRDAPPSRYSANRIGIGLCAPVRYDNADFGIRKMGRQICKHRIPCAKKRIGARILNGAKRRLLVGIVIIDSEAKRNIVGILGDPLVPFYGKRIFSR